MSEKAIRLLQGYLWLPHELVWDPEEALPAVLELSEASVSLLLEPVEPPFAFFDDGTSSAGQRFYQLTALAVSERDPRELHDWVAELEEKLAPLLEASPPGVGWLLLEDLRAL